ncbi:MAG: FAD-dependent oxidoreductase [Chitinophagaceae bacterium]|nr:FAD-dependent oxidoreductase [Oligoflexus sp.]
MPPHFLATLVHYERIGERYGILRLKPEGEQWTHNPGQYTKILFGTGALSFAKTYSIASAMRADGVLDFCIQLNDPQLLDDEKQWEVGKTQFSLTKPAGKFYLPNYASPVILLAGGSGVTPLKAILEDRLTNGDPKALSLLLYGCGDDAEIPFHDDLKSLSARHSQFAVRFFAEKRADKSRAEVGRPLDVLSTLIDTKAEYLMCGPPSFMEAARAQLTQAGISSQQIHQDRY